MLLTPDLTLLPSCFGGGATRRKPVSADSVDVCSHPCDACTVAELQVGVATVGKYRRFVMGRIVARGNESSQACSRVPAELAVGRQWFWEEGEQQRGKTDQHGTPD